MTLEFPLTARQVNLDCDWSRALTRNQQIVIRNDHKTGYNIYRKLCQYIISALGEIGVIVCQAGEGEHLSKEVSSSAVHISF